MKVDGLSLARPIWTTLSYRVSTCATNISILGGSTGNVLALGRTGKATLGRGWPRSPLGGIRLDASPGGTGKATLCRGWPLKNPPKGTFVYHQTLKPARPNQGYLAVLTNGLANQVVSMRPPWVPTLGTARRVWWSRAAGP